MLSPSLRKHKSWSVSLPALEASSILGAFESYAYKNISVFFEDDKLAFLFLTGTELALLPTEQLVTKIERCFSRAKTVGIVYLDDAKGSVDGENPRGMSWSELQVKVFESFFKPKSLSSSSSHPSCLCLNEPENLTTLLETFLLEHRKQKKRLENAMKAEAVLRNANNVNKAYALLGSATTNGKMTEHTALLLTETFGSLKEFARAGAAHGWETLGITLDASGREEAEELRGVVEFWDRDWEDD